MVASWWVCKRQAPFPRPCWRALQQGRCLRGARRGARWGYLWSVRDEWCVCEGCAWWCEDRMRAGALARADGASSDFLFGAIIF